MIELDDDATRVQTKNNNRTNTEALNKRVSSSKLETPTTLLQELVSLTPVLATRH